jgi:hypothetical protein
MSRTVMASRIQTLERQYLLRAQLLGNVAYLSERNCSLLVPAIAMASRFARPLLVRTTLEFNGKIGVGSFRSAFSRLSRESRRRGEYQALAATRPHIGHLIGLVAILKPATGLGFVDKGYPEFD